MTTLSLPRVLGLLLGGARATTQCTKGPCRPGNELCVGSKPQQYVFHLSDLTCAINDPNGPFYDEVHGVYHNFYQDHLAEPQPQMGPGRGPDWGHWVSKVPLPPLPLCTCLLRTACLPCCCCSCCGAPALLLSDGVQLPIIAIVNAGGLTAWLCD